MFTATDMALWLPELLPSGDAVVYSPIRRLDDGSQYSLAMRHEMVWDTLMRFFDYIMHKVHKGRAEYGEPTESWAHCECEPEGNFEIPENRPTPIDKIVRLVDTYIREVIVALNRNGFVTIESCSGLKQDHQGTTSIEPYVCFDDEYYLDVSAHLFTLANASGWDPTFGAHGYDVLFYTDAEGDKEIKRAWGRLEDMTGEFGEIRQVGVIACSSDESNAQTCCCECSMIP